MITALIDLMATYYQAGNLDQMEAIARTMLAAIPDDLVALQFLGLALYQMGRVDDARRVFRSVEDRPDEAAPPRFPTTGELAAVTSYREATRPGSRLAEGWQRIAQVLSKHGFRKAAARAFRASLATRGGELRAAPRSGGS